MPGLLSDTALSVAWALLPGVLILLGAAVAGGLIQSGGPIASATKIKPKLENISPLKGIKRLFSLRSVVEFLKGILKLTIVATVAAAIIGFDIESVMTAMELGAEQVISTIWWLSLRVLGGVCAVLTLIAAVDFLYQKFEFIKSLRMSKQDIKDELRQT